MTTPTPSPAVPADDEAREGASWTAEKLGAEKFRGPTAFADGRNGWARQSYECVAEPRFGYSWQRENRKDRGRQFYTVDGAEVSDLTVAAAILNNPPDMNSPREAMRRALDELKFSPKIGGATRALSDAQCNASAGPFATLRSWLQRADNAWHQGINHHADVERAAGRDWPSWLYRTKHAVHEGPRAMLLFAAEREGKEPVTCALGKRCAKCPILVHVEMSMRDAMVREKYPADIDDSDIDAAKAQTCIGHILTSGADPVDGVFFHRPSDRGSF